MAEAGIGALRSEVHFGRRMRCFSERPGNLVAMFAETACRFPDRPAVVEGSTYTYRELDLLASRIASALRSRGLRPGDRVAFFLGNCVEFVGSFLACVRSGLIVVPIGIRQQRPELEFLLEDSGAKAILFEAALAPLVPEGRDRLLRISVHGATEGADAFETLLPSNADAAPDLAIGEEDTAVILYTSGTTGKPKG
ncbi:MAG: AMP-dependent synthetase and ligase, partial [Tardiphaga sp.]|nr:AMP-dependent synthetase and ligase [Tardiphaga sp.]